MFRLVRCKSRKNGLLTKNYYMFQKEITENILVSKDSYCITKSLLKEIRKIYLFEKKKQIVQLLVYAVPPSETGNNFVDLSKVDYALFEINTKHHHFSLSGVLRSEFETSDLLICELLKYQDQLLFLKTEPQLRAFAKTKNIYVPMEMRNTKRITKHLRKVGMRKIVCLNSTTN